MTTLAALATKDSVVMGCDSLGSVTRRFVDPFELGKYFDPKKKFATKLDKEGKPFLKNFFDVYGKAQIIPYNHMTHVDKLFSLQPLEMGVMTTGIASVGNYTIKNLVNQFKSNDPATKGAKKPQNYTVKSIAGRLLKFIYKFYDKEFGKQPYKPDLELMVGGYDKQKHIPSVLKILVHENKIEHPLVDFGITFGGQMTEIQRIVFGTDTINKLRLLDRNENLLKKYHKEISDYLDKKNINIKIPKPDEKYRIFSSDWSLNEFDANFGDFSEKNAIECVKFFIDIMIKSQQFGNRLPTVGGDIHIALITKTEGFKIIQE